MATKKEEKNVKKLEKETVAELFGTAVSNDEPNAVEPERRTSPEHGWLNENFEGQLAVDVYQTDDTIVIQSTLAGVRVEDIDISVNNDMVTIRGIRQHEQEVAPQNYLYQECYWGGFSRSIILPNDVKGEKVSATLKNGILTVVLPKADKARAKTVKVREEPDEDET